eukprot:2506149-Rhodomonas_salina.2
MPCPRAEQRGRRLILLALLLIFPLPPAKPAAQASRADSPDSEGGVGLALREEPERYKAGLSGSSHASRGAERQLLEDQRALRRARDQYKELRDLAGPVGGRARGRSQDPGRRMGV